jgi:hypothetical protein
MADNSIQGLDVAFRVRVAGSGTAFKELVCSIDDQFQLTNDTNEKDTKCATFVGIKEAKGNISGNAVCNIAPTSSEASYKDVSGWQIAKTLMEFQYHNEAFTDANGDPVTAGAAIYFTGEGRFVDTTLKAPTGETVDFSWTFKPSGTISQVTPS